MELLLGVLTVFLTVVLVGSAVHKARNVTNFADVIAAYDLAPARTSSWIAGFLLVAEFAAAALLALTPVAGALGLAAAAAIFGVYAAAITVNILRGHVDIDCGCSWAGGGGARLTFWHVLRAATLFAAAAAGAIVIASGAATASGVSLLWGIFGAAPLAAAYLGADALIDNWSKLTGETV